MSTEEEPMIGLVKAGMWPVLTLMALVAFYEPVYSVVDALANRSSQITTLKLGILELSIRADELPKPAAETAKILTSLDTDLIKRLFWAEENFGICHRPNIPSSNLEKQGFERLVELGQITLTAEAADPNMGCATYYSGEFTPAGQQTKQFLLSLLSAQISTARTDT